MSDNVVKTPDFLFFFLKRLRNEEGHENVNNLHENRVHQFESANQYWSWTPIWCLVMILPLLICYFVQKSGKMTCNGIQGDPKIWTFTKTLQNWRSLFRFKVEHLPNQTEVQMLSTETLQTNSTWMIEILHRHIAKSRVCDLQPPQPHKEKLWTGQSFSCPQKLLLFRLHTSLLRACGSSSLSGKRIGLVFSLPGWYLIV